MELSVGDNGLRWKVCTLGVVVEYEKKNAFAIVCMDVAFPASFNKIVHVVLTAVLHGASPLYCLLPYVCLADLSILVSSSLRPFRQIVGVAEECPPLPGVACGA